MRFIQWVRYAFRDPWDFADPEAVAAWPEECRDSGSDPQGGDANAAPGEASQSGGNEDCRIAQPSPPSSPSHPESTP